MAAWDRLLSHRGPACLPRSELEAARHVSWKAWCFADEDEDRIDDEPSDDRELPFILDTLTENLKRRGRIAIRPDDDRLARLILEEYIRFPG